MSNSKEAQEIQRQMAEIRSELREGVDEIFEQARVLADWRYYVRTYPWACVAAAVAAGYLAVPRRIEVITPDAATIAKLAKQNRLVVRPSAESQPREGLAGAAFGFLANMLLRGALSYASGQAGKFFGRDADAVNGKAGRSGGPA